MGAAFFLWPKNLKQDCQQYHFNEEVSAEYRR
jgi:hypothetical protein